MPTRQPRYPRDLKDLLHDERYPTARRYLRKLYPDPITGGDWAIMKAPDGGIMGIHSTSTAAPLKVRGAAATYQDLKFAYIPATAAPEEAGSARRFHQRETFRRCGHARRALIQESPTRTRNAPPFRAG